ncbi:MAG: hypothetical protein CL609_10880 [Anaerolineaceae bacterium]|nr:hypothetical protein [Anaerolineaceae bacterium]
METISNKLIAAGILAVLTLISGMMVSRSGKPLNIWLVTLHKLIAVAGVVLIVIIVNQLFKSADGKTIVTIGLMTISAILFLALIATGAFLTREEMELPAFVLKIHQVVPLLALASSSLTVYLLLPNKG